MSHSAASDVPNRTDQLVIVANRLPLEQAPDGTLRRSPGGLASALSAVSDENTAWVGWTGGVGALEQPLADPSLVPVELSALDVERYYQGFSNSVLWPLFHGRLRQPRMLRSWWRTYQAVNRTFADKVAEIAPRSATVWVNDYHLMLVPKLLRGMRPDLRIGFFLHIPFPSIDLFATLPWRTELVQGLCGADLLGFQTDHDASNATAAIDRLAAGRGTGGRQRTTRDVEIDAFPISIDFEYWDDLGASRAADAEQLRSEEDGRFLFVGVDRLDYTKGIDQRLRAFGELLDESQLDAERCTFVQISVPSREGLGAYETERAEVEEIVESVNTRHRRADGSTPIRHITTGLRERQLAGWYRAADSMVVTSYADGMNLVAKEFVATRGDLRGSLILSEFAGAARGLPGALIVNPYDTDAVKRSMLLAHSMSTAEQTERMRGMRRSVRDHDIYAWAGEFLTRLRPAPPRPARAHAARTRRATDATADVPADTEAMGEP